MGREPKYGVALMKFEKAATVAPAEPMALPTFEPDPITQDDFFRLRRKGNGWVTEMVRLVDGKVAYRRDVWEWDTFDNAERRMVGYAAEAERRL